MAVRRALLIDDDEQDRAYLSMHLEDAGIEVLAPDRTYNTVLELVELAESSNVDLTICDHRLQPRKLANFYGAEAVASLVQRSNIAILMTSYHDDVYDTTIRQHRQHIPALLRREELEEPEALEGVIDAIQREIDGLIPDERKLWKTVVRIGDVTGSGPDLALDVFVPAWRPGQAVRMPAVRLPEELALLGQDLIGTFLLAEVNTAAPDNEQLFFGLVERAVEPIDWPETEVGTGSILPTRDDNPPGLFGDPSR